MQDKQEILLESGTNELEIIEFQIEREQPDGTVKTGYYGINVAKVREIIKPPTTTDYPNAHPCVYGIFSLRERLIPLVDLAQWLGLSAPREYERKRVIVTEFNGLFTGFLVDHVTRIYRLSWESVESPSEFLESENDCVVAVVRLEQRLIMLLDFEKITADINPEVGVYNIHEDRGMDAPELVEQRARHRVMVVDDSSFIRKQLVHIVSEAGFEVMQASNGKEALEILVDAEAPHFDAVITDIEMPIMDGMHLIKRLRELETYEHTPIMVFSSIVSDENANKARSLGAQECITKPQMGNLVHRLDAYIGIR